MGKKIFENEPEVSEAKPKLLRAGDPGDDWVICQGCQEASKKSARLTKCPECGHSLS